MKSSFRVYVRLLESELEVPVSYHIFNGGEVSMSLDVSCIDCLKVQECFMIARVLDSDGVLALVQLKDIIDHYFPKAPVELVLPYMPYARQDRRCNRGESFGIKVFANIINSLDFEGVVVVDPHSHVTEAVLDKAYKISKGNIFGNNKKGVDMIANYDTFVAPDAGAAKEVFNLATKYGKRFIQGSKVRDTKTGELSGFSYEGYITGHKCLIVDDICDGGGTFNGLADVMLKDNPRSIGLYVTHGIFSKDLTELSKRFDNIYTTNTFKADLYKNQSLECIFKI